MRVEWRGAYPSGVPDSSRLPRPWVDALNTAVADGKIPNIPQSHNTPQTNPIYPQGVNPNSPEVCSATYKCRNPGDLWDAPTGYFGTGFDDGPLPVSAEGVLRPSHSLTFASGPQSSTRLYDFLEENDEIVTHFMIGVNILNNPQQFRHAFETLEQDIAVHTWTHPYMTTLSNLDIVAQLGWTMSIIHDSSGGRLPRFWRPPYGDSDNRVRAIAKEVFGLDTIIWNREYVCAWPRETQC